MQTGSSDTLSRGHRGRSRQDARLKKARKARYRWIDLEGLESRTLLATTPAATATGAALNLTGLTNYPTLGGNANSPTVVVDPYNSNNIFAVWGVDLSDTTPTPTTTAVIDGAYSNNGGATIAFTGTLTDGFGTVTGVSSTAGLAVGQPITGTGIPTGTTIAGISTPTHTVFLTNAATVSAVSEGLTATTLWHSIGPVVSPLLDPLTVNATPPLPYTQITDPSIGFDSQGNVYILAMESTGATDGALVLSEYNFAGAAPTPVSQRIIYQWITGSDAATSPALAVDAGTYPNETPTSTPPSTPPAGVPQDPYANNVYIAWASIDQEPINPNPYAFTGFNPDRAELVVGTPIPNANKLVGTESSLAFSGVTTVNAFNDLFSQRNTHPQLVISPGNSTDPGQITVAWEDAGTNATNSPPQTILDSNNAQPGDTYGFTGATGIVPQGTSVSSSSSNQGNWGTATIYNAGPSATVAEDPTSVSIGDVASANSNLLNDIVVTNSAPNNSTDSGIGVLLNQGAGVFPAAGVTANELFPAGPNPTSVVLGDLVPGHSTTTIQDAAVANDDPAAGSVSILPNGPPNSTPPTDGEGIFLTPTSLSTAGEQGTSAVVDGFFDGTSKLSLIAVNSTSNSISIFPDSSSANAYSIPTATAAPIAVTAGPFTGGADDIAVLYSNGTIQCFVISTSGPGNIQLTAQPAITGLNAAAIAPAFLNGGLEDLVVADKSGNVEWLANTSTSGGTSITFNPAPNAVYTVPGAPVGIAAGQLSTNGNYVGFEDVAVAYGLNGPTGESMVAVFQNINGVLTHTAPPGQPSNVDYDAGGKNPTAIAVGQLTGNSALPWDDIVVTNGGTANRGTISVLQPAALPSSSTTTPHVQPFTDNVAVPAAVQSAINNLTVTVDVTDQQPVSNLKIVLIAPNLNSITLVENQINSLGTAVTSQGLPTGNAIGVFGYTPPTTTSPGTPGTQIGTIFDDNADRNIFDATTGGVNGNTAVDYVGYFEPEDPTQSLGSFISSLGGAINGAWTLQVWNYYSSTSTVSPGNLEHFSLQFSTGMTQPVGSGQVGIAVTNLAGSLTNSYPTPTNYPSSPTVGVGPGLVLAIDNTLGPNSPYQGRIYAAYVGYQYPDPSPDGVNNPVANTDIFLSYYVLPTPANPSGFWVSQGIVNDDNASTDGFSSAGTGTGRTQFQPEVAVDQATGTLVVSWRDARDDASNARVATYVATSIDGGNSFSPQTYANTADTATDAITGQADVIGPEADNQSALNPQADAAFGYGDQMGLAVFNGQLYPIWAGNLNQSSDPAGAIIGDPLNIWYAPMVIAAGPRIVASSMGPIPLAATTNPNGVSISVTFDRPINTASFLPQDVQIFYHDTISNTDSFVSLNVIGITVVSSTQFTITFDPTPTGANPATYDYTGTYSYVIAPDAGLGTTPISAPVWSWVGGTLRTDDPDDQNADGKTDSNALTSPFTGQTPGDVYAAPTPAIPTTTAVTTFSSITNILKPVFGFNSNTLPLIVPGPQVLSTSVTSMTGASGTGAAGSYGGLISDGTTSSYTLNFDRPMLVNTAPAGQTPTPGSFNPAQVLSIMGPAGEITGPQYYPSDVQTGQPITGTAPLMSTVTIPSFGGTFTIANITVSLTAAFSPDSDLAAVLIAPDGTQVPLFSGVGGTGSNFINTEFSDSAETPIASGTAPFTGIYKPTGTLASLNNLPVDFKNTFGLWVPGVWTLELTASQGATGVLDNWSLSVTPQISVTPVAATESLGGAAATSFQIGFPLQQLSGTYTVQLGPNIVDTANPADAMDVNQNAGLDVLRDTGQNAPTTTVVYKSADLPKPIPAPAMGVAGSVGSAITVPDNFLVQGDITSPTIFTGRLTSGSAIVTLVSSTKGLTSGQPVGGTGIPIGTTIQTINTSADTIMLSANATASGVETLTATGLSGLRVQINLSYPADPDLSATLEHTDPSGNVLASIPLFMNVGSGSNEANFTNTVFDDNGTTPIQNGAAPFFATFTPQQSLATAFAGVSAQGTWTLVITNSATGTGGAGTFNSWSLSFQKLVPTSGLGEPGADDFSGSFRIFTLSQADALSSEAWTAVGPAAIGSGPTAVSGSVSALAVDPSDPSGNTVYAAGATGGIWKTTDFLTTDPSGPTWIPLTDFGPTSGVNIGAITIFPRNDDPNQSIIIAATGTNVSGRPDSPGVGFLVSENGGATWVLDDSTTNVDSSGNELPIVSGSRDRTFVGDIAYQVTVDPKPTIAGGVIIYAALSGPTGGIWRSLNTGATWQLMLSGQATSVALAPESGQISSPSNSGTNVLGNLQVVYAGIAGSGVWMSPNQGQVWNELLGGVGNPLIFDSYYTPSPNVNPVSSLTPNGAFGRIVLTVPAATGNDAFDAVYEGWLYAVVDTTGGALDGIFVTKDFGQNWTEITIPTAEANYAIPDNQVPGLTNYPVITSPPDMAIAVDPTDPSVIYVGGDIPPGTPRRPDSFASTSPTSGTLTTSTTSLTTRMTAGG